MKLSTTMVLFVAVSLVTSGLVGASAARANEGKGVPQQIEALSAEIEGLSGEIEGLDSDIEALSSDIEGLGNDIEALSDAVAELGGSAVSPGQFISVLMSPFADDCTNTGSRFDTLQNPDGTEVPFEIPEGQVLVVTDIEILGFDATPGDNVQTRVFTGIGLAVNNVSRRESVASAEGRLFDIFAFNPGIVVPSGGEICINNSGGATNSGRLRGYLAEE